MEDGPMAQINEKTGERATQGGVGEGKNMEERNAIQGLFGGEYGGTVQGIKERIAEAIKALKILQKEPTTMQDSKEKKYETFDGRNGRRVDEEYKNSKEIREKFIMELTEKEEKENDGKRESKKAGEIHDMEFCMGYKMTVENLQKRLVERMTDVQGKFKMEYKMAVENLKKRLEEGNAVEKKEKKLMDRGGRFVMKYRMVVEGKEHVDERKHVISHKTRKFLLEYSTTVNGLQKRLEEGMSDIQEKFRVEYKTVVGNFKQRLEKGHTVERKETLVGKGNTLVMKYRTAERKESEVEERNIAICNDTQNQFRLKYNMTVQKLQKTLEEGMANVQEEFKVEYKKTVHNFMKRLEYGSRVQGQEKEDSKFNRENVSLEYRIMAERKEDHEERKENKKSKEREIEFMAEYRQTVESLQKRLEDGMTDVQEKFTRGYEMTVESIKNRFEEGTREREEQNVTTKDTSKMLNIEYRMHDERIENVEEKRNQNSKDIRDEFDLEFMEYRMTAQSIQKILEEGMQDVQELFTVEYKMVVENLKKRLEEGPKNLSTAGRGKSKETISEPLQKQTKGSLENPISKSIPEAQKTREEDITLRSAGGSAETSISEKKTSTQREEPSVFSGSVSTSPGKRPPAHREEMTTHDVVNFVLVVVVSFLFTLALTRNT